MPILFKKPKPPTQQAIDSMSVIEVSRSVGHYDPKINDAWQSYRSSFGTAKFDEMLGLMGDVRQHGIDLKYRIESVDSFKQRAIPAIADKTGDVRGAERVVNELASFYEKHKDLDSIPDSFYDTLRTRVAQAEAATAVRRLRALDQHGLLPSGARLDVEATQNLIASKYEVPMEGYAFSGVSPEIMRKLTPQDYEAMESLRRAKESAWVNFCHAYYSSIAHMMMSMQAVFQGNAAARSGTFAGSAKMHQYDPDTVSGFLGETTAEGMRAALLAFPATSRLAMASSGLEAAGGASMDIYGYEARTGETIDAWKKKLIIGANAGLEVVSAVIQKGIYKAGGKIMTSSALGRAVANRMASGLAGVGFTAASEALQEPGEEMAQNALAMIYDDQRELTEGIGRAAAMGAILGPVGGAVSAGSLHTPKSRWYNQRGLLTSKAKSIAGKLLNKSFEEGKSAVHQRATAASKAKVFSGEVDGVNPVLEQGQEAAAKTRLFKQLHAYARGHLERMEKKRTVSKVFDAALVQDPSAQPDVGGGEVYAAAPVDPTTQDPGPQPQDPHSYVMDLLTKHASDPDTEAAVDESGHRRVENFRLSTLTAAAKELAHANHNEMWYHIADQANFAPIAIPQNASKSEQRAALQLANTTNRAAENPNVDNKKLNRILHEYKVVEDKRFPDRKATREDILQAINEIQRMDEIATRAEAVDRSLESAPGLQTNRNSYRDRSKAKKLNKLRDFFRPMRHLMARLSNILNDHFIQKLYDEIQFYGVAAENDIHAFEKQLADIDPELATDEFDRKLATYFDDIGKKENQMRRNAKDGILSQEEEQELFHYKAEQAQIFETPAQRDWARLINEKLTAAREQTSFNRLVEYFETGDDAVRPKNVTDQELEQLETLYRVAGPEVLANEIKGRGIGVRAVGTYYPRKAVLRRMSDVATAFPGQDDDPHAASSIQTREAATVERAQQTPLQTMRRYLKQQNYETYAKPRLKQIQYLIREGIRDGKFTQTDIDEFTRDGKQYDFRYHFRKWQWSLMTGTITSKSTLFERIVTRFYGQFMKIALGKVELSARNALQIVALDEDVASTLLHLPNTISTAVKDIFNKETGDYVERYVIAPSSLARHFAMDIESLWQRVPGLKQVDDLAKMAAHVYTGIVDPNNRRGSFAMKYARAKRAVHNLQQRYSNWHDSDAAVREFLSKSGADTSLTEPQIANMLDIFATDGDEAGLRYLAHQHTLEVHNDYSAAGRALAAHGGFRPAHSLLTFSTGQFERLARRLLQVFGKSTPLNTRINAAKNIATWFVGSFVANKLLKATLYGGGTSYEPYEWPELFQPGFAPGMGIISGAVDTLRQTWDGILDGTATDQQISYAVSSLSRKFIPFVYAMRRVARGLTGRKDLDRSLLESLMRHCQMKEEKLEDLRRDKRRKIWKGLLEEPSVGAAARLIQRSPAKPGEKVDYFGPFTPEE